MANKYAGTQTEKNLLEAFSGESQARNKYTYFASKAKKDGFEQIASLFLKTADNEKEHAKMWFKELNGIGSTAENLAAAAEGENYEWTDMYELRKRVSQSLQRSSVSLVRSRSSMKNAIAHFCIMWRCRKYLRRAKSRYGSAETADIS